MIGINDNSNPLGLISKIESLEEEITYLKDLIKSLQKYITISEKAKDIIYLHDIDGNITYVNDYCQTISGYSLQELLSMNVNDIMPDNLIEPVLEKRKRRLNGDLKVELYNTSFYSKSGKLISVEASSIPIIEDGKWQATLVLGRDITKRKQYEKRIEELNKNLILLNKILRHDIANDLTVISIALETIETKNEELKTKAMKAIDRSVDLIEKIRLIESSISIKEELVPINVRDCADFIAKTYSDIEINIAGNCMVLADGGLNSIVENILNNAIVHGKTSKIDINIDEKEDSCVLTISDYGKGIPDNIKGQIFDEEFSYGENRGTGLGLYIVKNLLERYDGSIKVEDNKPNGTSFVITLKKQ